MTECGRMDVNGNILIVRMNDAFQWGCDISGAFRSSVESTVFTDRFRKDNVKPPGKDNIIFFTLLYFTFLFSTDTTPEVAT